MPTEPAQVVPPTQRPHSTRQISRDERVAAVIDMEAARAARAASGRAVAKARGIAPSTLRGWAQRAHPAEEGTPDAVRRFFETPEGLALLHRIVLAALFVIVLRGGSGVSLVRFFLRYCGLHTLVACSDRHLDARVRALLQVVHRWGQGQRTDLAASMPPRAIAVVPDETFPDGMLLVAQEPVSGFLLVEQHSERRDADTWARALREGLAGLPVTVEQVTSDEASGLRALAREKLGVPHNSDVFHGQNELCKGIFGALRGLLRRADDAVTAAKTATRGVLAARANFLARPRAPGRPPDWQARIGRAAERSAEAQVAHYDLSEQSAGLRVAIRDLGETISPVDLRTGAWQSPAGVRALLVGIFEEILERVSAVGLGDRTLHAVDKAMRLIDSWVGSIAWWQRQVEARLVAAQFAPDLTLLVRTVLIPAALLEAARKRAPTKALRAAYGAVVAELTAPLRDPAGLWSRLPEPLRQAVGALARACASQWQRSSSGLEGRNGYLSMRHHHLHALPTGWLQMLTVLHNYVIQRADGTTAAERFFGCKPADLFEHLVAVTPLPPRPRVRAREPVPDLFAAAA